jgi:hypothetical protein
MLHRFIVARLFSMLVSSSTMSFLPASISIHLSNFTSICQFHSVMPSINTPPSLPPSSSTHPRTQHINASLFHKLSITKHSQRRLNNLILLCDKVSSIHFILIPLHSIKENAPSTTSHPHLTVKKKKPKRHAMQYKKPNNALSHHTTVSGAKARRKLHTAKRLGVKRNATPYPYPYPYLQSSTRTSIPMPENPLKTRKNVRRKRVHTPWYVYVEFSKTSPAPSSADLCYIPISTASFTRPIDTNDARLLIRNPLPGCGTHLPAAGFSPPPYNLQPRERGRITRRMHRRGAGSRGPSMHMCICMAWRFVLSNNALATPTDCLADPAWACFRQSRRRLRVVVICFYARETGCCVAGWGA